MPPSRGYRPSRSRSSFRYRSPMPRTFRTTLFAGPMSQGGARSPLPIPMRHFQDETTRSFVCRVSAANLLRHGILMIALRYSRRVHGHATFPNEHKRNQTSSCWRWRNWPADTPRLGFEKTIRSPKNAPPSLLHVTAARWPKAPVTTLISTQPTNACSARHMHSGWAREQPVQVISSACVTVRKSPWPRITLRTSSSSTGTPPTGKRPSILSCDALSVHGHARLRHRLLSIGGVSAPPLIRRRSW